MRIGAKVNKGRNNAQNYTYIVFVSQSNMYIMGATSVQLFLIKLNYYVCMCVCERERDNMCVCVHAVYHKTRIRYQIQVNALFHLHYTYSLP